ncbi:hypothetical protein BAE44_0008005 [Dichanthelium oligosanthes]|uniref:RNase H type-1 domain-containing protein n=1 Tax=Dichanthelium oligosanthes TaxID=888268 RepID=A0A1E5W0V3_9POAL|nr:hypothetical protein BAE44_0008005 [Dichanthelium oligosanthes]
MDSATPGEPFYVVRKGDIIGIYKTLSECQAQVSNSVRDPSVTVFKGYSLRKDTEEYLAARGLRNALYAIDAADARDELFDDLVPCPFQQPEGAASSALKRSHEIVSSIYFLATSVDKGLFGRAPSDYDSLILWLKLSCILEFDGASKGNPGKSGAGAIIRRLDGSVIAQLREGLGIATNNAAEYRALILGLKYAAKKGFKYIRAQGDSKLVCNQVSGNSFAISALGRASRAAGNCSNVQLFLNKSNTLRFLEQVQDLWRARNDNMAGLCKKVKELKGTFQLFQIRHVLRCWKLLALYMVCHAKLNVDNHIHIINSQRIPGSKKGGRNLTRLLMLKLTLQSNFLVLGLKLRHICSVPVDRKGRDNTAVVVKVAVI